MRQDYNYKINRENIIILVVDDNDFALKTMKIMLEYNKFKVKTSINGKDCIDKFYPFQDIDLIITDLKMPEMDGIELLKYLRNNNVTIPVVIYSAMNEISYVIQAMQLGADDYALKGSTNVKTLIPTIEKLLEKEEVKKSNLKLTKDLLEKNEQLSKVNKELVQLNDLKIKYLGMAAHDLRNPLASIRGFAEILIMELAEKISEEQLEYLNLIQSSSNGMLSLVNDLLDISVIQSGRLTLNLKPCNLKKLLNDQIRIHKARAEKKLINLNTDINELPELTCDSNRISQVVDNLLSNAIKFSPPNSNIRVTLSKYLNLAQITIQDEGPGIPVNDQDKLFKEFQKGTAKPTSGESSTGLGLAIVKKILDAHKGALNIESDDGKGTTFSFYLPMDQ